MSELWTNQLKSVLDSFDNTNMRISFVYQDSQLVAIKLEQLPLSSNVVYRAVVDFSKRSLKVEKLG